MADLDAGLVAATLDEIHRMVDVAVDRMRLSAAPIPVILVGGGAILICRPIQGASEIVKPNYSVVSMRSGRRSARSAARSTGSSRWSA